MTSDRAGAPAGQAAPADGAGATERVGRLADQIARAVAGCPGVAGLAAGPIATYLPRRIVPGVAVRDRTIRVAIVARYGFPLIEVADRVRAAVQPQVPGWPVHVRVDDLDPVVGARRRPEQLAAATGPRGRR